MRTARLITIGTEITTGEIVNSNASWVSRRLEARGVRVYSHLSVRDHKEEILAALGWAPADYLIVTGGLGPTSDDLTRACVAEFAGVKLEFDAAAWEELERTYAQRGLKIREAHRHQCWFPEGSTRLKNPVGSAWGFSIKNIFVLPGPPRELEGMWNLEVEPRLSSDTTKTWVRWTCLGAPESEVAELVEPLLGGVEVGYRAQIPFVRVKVYVDATVEAARIAKIGEALKPWLVGEDIAEELMREYPGRLVVHDEVCGPQLFQRLSEHGKIEYHSTAGRDGLSISREGEELVVRVAQSEQRMIMPYKIKLDSERGRRSATEWSIWLALKSIREASKRQP